jgi:hypothetical protein
MMPSLRRLSPPSRLFLSVAAAIPVLLLLGLVTVVGRAVALHQDLRDAEAQARAAAMASASGITPLQAEAVFIHANSGGLAAAVLEKRISDALGHAGLTPRSMEVLPESAHGPGAVLVSVEVTGDVGRVSRALYELETGTPLLFVRDMELRNERGSEAVAPDAPVDLSVRLVVEGHVRLERRS